MGMHEVSYTETDLSGPNSDNVTWMIPKSVQYDALTGYLILDRSLTDFAAVLCTYRKPVLEVLLLMLERPNSEHDDRTKALNAVGAVMVRAHLEAM